MKIRLSSNENPYGPSEKARKAVLDILSEGNRYTFQSTEVLRKILAEREGVTPDYIAIGAGSSSLLCAAGAAFGLEGGRILSAFPTFPMLMNFSEAFRATWDKVNLNDDFEHDYRDIAAAIKSDTRLVFICNPNNPTGTLVDPAVVKAFCEEVSTRVPVFSDEAYLEFLEPDQQVSMVELVKRDKNVIVSRTFSKIYGLAGFRVGYIVAKPELIRKVSRCQPAIPNNQFGLAAAMACVGDEEFMTMSRRKNAEARKYLTDYLDKKGFRYAKSHTNFVFFDPRSNAENILQKLNEEGIGIRLWDYEGRPWCRVSIGTLDEMKVFTRTFDAIIS